LAGNFKIGLKMKATESKNNVAIF